MDEFINIHIKNALKNHKNLPINFIGSVSYFLSNEIKEAAKRHNPNCWENSSKSYQGSHNYSKKCFINSNFFKKSILLLVYANY